jgi:outer membrane lipoprotein carrier protein
MSNGAQAPEDCQDWKGRGLSLAASDVGQKTAWPVEGHPAKISRGKARLVAAGAPLFRGKCLLMAVFCFTWAISAIADSSSPSAKELAQRVDHHYNSLHSLKAGFTETYQGLGTDRTESGTLLLLKPGRMKWDYSSPPGKVFVLDGKYAWSYTRGEAQAERIPAKELNDLRSPLRYLLGHAELGKELENLKAAPAANGQFTLTGIPKGMESRVSRLTLTVTADGVIDGITMVETDDAVTRFTFTNQQPNVSIPAATFHFTPPPGVQVQDSMAPI